MTCSAIKGGKYWISLASKAFFTPKEGVWGVWHNKSYHFAEESKSKFKVVFELWAYIYKMGYFQRWEACGCPGLWGGNGKFRWRINIHHLDSSKDSKRNFEKKIGVNHICLPVSIISIWEASRPPNVHFIFQQK